VIGPFVEGIPHLGFVFVMIVNGARATAFRMIE